MLGLLLAGFIAGFSTYERIRRITGFKNAPNTKWQDMAREQDWIPKSECPAYPISLDITSPGDGTIVKYLGIGTPALETDLVIQSSRPIPLPTSMGLIYNEDGDSNFYVSFPYFNDYFPDPLGRNSRKIFRREEFVFLPFQPKDGTKLNLWAIAVADQRMVGSVYSSLEQIETSTSGAVISEKISITLRE